MRQIFQTLRDDDPDNVEEKGPFECTHKNAWLHNGYYFWDEDVDLAHWWGRTYYGNNYIISKSEFNYRKALDDDLIWDLHNEHKFRTEFRAIVAAIKQKNINKGKPIKVRAVIEELQSKGFFKYKATRLSGLNSIGKKDEIFERHLLEQKQKRGQHSFSWMYDNRPAIQICFYEKFCLERNVYKIVHPEEYVQDEVVF